MKQLLWGLYLRLKDSCKDKIILMIVTN